VRHSPLTTSGPGHRSPDKDPGKGPSVPLVAVAHGSSDPRAAASVDALLSLVRARAAAAGYPGLDVRAAYLGHAAPTLAQALGAVDGAAVVLPLLLTAAYHSKTDIPKVLHEVRRARPRLGISYGRPLGPHPLLRRALERRLAEAADGEPPSASTTAQSARTTAQSARTTAQSARTTAQSARTTAQSARTTVIVLAAAGSSDPAANAVITDQAARWQAERGWRAVLTGYASAASPSPPEAVAAARRSGARRVLVASYLLCPGVFADQVRSDCLAAGADAVSPVLGAAPEIADIVLGRYAESLTSGAVSLTDGAAAV
jgi:sirohydrochlorin ferrochelatase